jgi:hypothetical protein
MLIPDYAIALTNAGIATLALDYVGFGASSGKVRQDIQPDDQIRTFKDALGVLEKDSRFDSKNLGRGAQVLVALILLLFLPTIPELKLA